ncbi:MAG: serine/threonine protein kinase [Myxococcales bacterium]|nr:serine/threonine protein kinase [Myxococcales bacterium]
MKRCPRCNARFDDGLALCAHDGATLVELPDPLLGRTLAERYKLVQRIGAGGMGTVYRARHLLLRRDVAVKLLSAELTRDPVMRQRFLREAQTTSMLRHPNIVEIYDIAEENNRAFLVMELLEGASLASRLGAGALPIDEAVALCIPVASALARAHALGVVHRDIKPENVFVARRAQGTMVKVLDFGIAHLRFEARLTAPGEIFGTPEYLAAELARGEPCVPASDLYALGVMLFELVTGSLPFDGDLVRLIEHHRVTPAPSARARNAEVPDALDALLKALMAKQPSERPASAAAVEETLTRLLDATRGASPAPRLRPLRETLEITPIDEADDEKKTVPRVMTTPPSLATLRHHRVSFEAAVATVHPKGPPAWVGDALGVLDATLGALDALEDKRRAAVRDAADANRRASEERHQLRDRVDLHARAIEAAEADLEALAPEIDELLRDEATALNAITFGWNDLGSPPSNPRGLGPERLLLLESLGRQATALRALQQSLAARQTQREALRLTLSRSERLRDESLAQLEGLDDAGRLRDEALKTEAVETGREVDALYARLQQYGDALAAHLVAFPAARGLIHWVIRPAPAVSAEAPDHGAAASLRAGD